MERRPRSATVDALPGQTVPRLHVRKYDVPTFRSILDRHPDAATAVERQ